MNQELKHRLIGAVVVTALAAIFIPMLFEDPIDDTGRLVSELAIPAEPGNSAEAPENKAPASLDQALETPSGESGQPVNGQSSLAESAANEPEPEADNPAGTALAEGGQAENGAPEQPQVMDSAEAGAEGYVEEEMPQDMEMSENGLAKQDQEPASLDTGMVEEVKQAVKTGKAAGVSAAYQRRPVSKQAGASKPATGVVTAPAKKTAKDTASNAQKSIASVKSPVSVAAEGSKTTANKAKETPKKAAQQELVRWYLQAGSFGRKDNALSLFETLRTNPQMRKRSSRIHSYKTIPPLFDEIAIDVPNRQNKNHCRIGELSMSRSKS
jgi:DedD protein